MADSRLPLWEISAKLQETNPHLFGELMNAVSGRLKDEMEGLLAAAPTDVLVHQGRTKSLRDLYTTLSEGREKLAPARTSANQRTSPPGAPLAS